MKLGQSLSEELELIAAPPAPVIAPKEEEVKAEPLEPELEHLESTPTATDDQEVLEEKPVIMKEEVVATAVAPAPAIGNFAYFLLKVCIKNVI